MAIRIRKGRKNPFLVYWRNPFTQKIESKSFAAKEEAEKHNAFVQYQLRYERESFRPVEEATTEEQMPNTFESVFYLYLRDRKFAEDNLYRTLKAVKAILEKYGDIEIDKIDTKVLRDMQQICLDAGNKGATVHRKMTIIKAVLSWACRRELLAFQPVYPESPKSVTARYVPPTPEEISRLYNVSPSHLQRVIILGFMFGVRVGPCELFRIKWTDVNWAEKYVRVRNAKKGNEAPWREVPIKDELLPLFEKWSEEDRKLGMEYVVHYRGKPVKRVRHSWKSALANAGISRHIRPYDLRHGFATEALAAGGDCGTVSAIMGHKNQVTVLRHYQHIKDSRKKAVIENLPQPDLKIPCMTKCV